MMGYERSKFGDGLPASSSTNVQSDVHNHYGPRDTGKTVGTVFTQGGMRELAMDIDGDMVGDAAFALKAPVLPAGAKIEDVFLEVKEVFVLGGTTPAIEIGTEGTEATNGVTITEAQAEAAGTYDITSAVSGTWAAGLAADTTVGIALSGSGASVTSAGKLRVTVRYFQM